MAETLEQANAEIISLQEQLTEVTNERDTFKTENDKLKKDYEDVRKLNQNYFNKLSMQYEKEDQMEQEEEKVKSCEELAKTIIF